ncbi:MAG TPA: DNA methyltransferase [Candidatus Krumholzibacteria bacterium]|nr:DNA methyltransferase [Candidatus Krumholzibacteria bacterium]HRY42255.1 DNA methyltransferase [Candidatus Krumholzibacteria bacterium]
MTLPPPYYQDSAVTIYHADCRDILPLLPKVDLVLTDPPYGISHPTDYATRGRDGLTSCNNYPPVYGDSEKFDPSHLLRFPCVLWGANYFASKLPETSGWLVWDKERPDGIDQATCELAWTNFVKGVRRFRYLWNGCMRAGSEVLCHPTQKPVALMSWVLGLQWTPPGVVLDPYMGSGPVLRAAKDLGRKAIGIEIEERYCEIAAKRMAQEVLL